MTPNARDRLILTLLVAALATLAPAADGAFAHQDGAQAVQSGSVLHDGRHRATRRHHAYLRLGVALRARTRNGVSTLSPANGQTLSGNVVWQAAVSGATPSQVDFAVDGVVKRSQSTLPFAYGGNGNLDTTSLTNGRHNLTVIAYGNRRTGSTSSTVTVNVTNSISTPAPSSAPTRTPPPTAESPEVPAPEPEPSPSPAPEPSPAPAPEPSPSPAPTPSASSIYWGAWIGEQLTGGQAPWDMTAVSKFEEMAGKPMSLIHFASPFANCATSPCTNYNFPTGPMESIRKHGAIPFFSWASQSTPSSLNEPNYQLSDVINGTYDSYIRSFATAAKNWGHPFFLRFNWEMNGGWFPWAEGVNGNKAGEYVAAWRHVHDIFTSVGATNATWVWCPNVDPEGRLQNLSSLYPGNAYVDWTCLDGYNWGTNPAKPDRWRTFDQLYNSTYHGIVDEIAPSKPMIIGEVGSTEYGGSKATWISDMLSKIPTAYPKIRGLLWFERYDDGMDWPIETSTSATSAFAAGIQNPAYVGNNYGALSTSAAIAPPS